MGVIFGVAKKDATGGGGGGPRVLRFLDANGLFWTGKHVKISAGNLYKFCCRASSEPESRLWLIGD